MEVVAIIPAYNEENNRICFRVPGAVKEIKKLLW